METRHIEETRAVEANGQACAARKTYRRKRFFIYPSVQGTYIAFSVGPAVLATLFLHLCPLLRGRKRPAISKRSTPYTHLYDGRNGEELGKGGLHREVCVNSKKAERGIAHRQNGLGRQLLRNRSAMGRHQMADLCCYVLVPRIGWRTGSAVFPPCRRPAI